jgi:excisionase family DNA binding protein
LGEHRPGHDQEQDQERLLTLAEAAKFLGLSKDAIRMRVRRGTLRSQKGGNGVVYVFRGDLDATTDATAYEPTDEPEPQREVEASRELVDTLKEQVEDLRARLDRETEANRENRRIIAGLLERVPALESGSSEPRDPSVPAEEGEPGATPTEPRPGPQAPASRPWWRFWGS